MNQTPAPRGLVDRLLSGCFGLLASAAALYLAARLIEAVAIALVIIGAVILIVGLIFTIARLRNRGW